MEGTELDLGRLEEVGPLLTGIKKVKRQTFWIRVGFVFLVLFIVGGWFWAILAHFKAFDVEAFGAEMGKKAEQSWPAISDELDKLLKNVIPMAEASINKELEEASPQIAGKLESEAKALEEGIKLAIADAVKGAVAAELKAQAAKDIQAAFPALSNPEVVDKLTADLQGSFMTATERVLTGTMTEFYDTLLKFETAFKQIKAGTPDGQKPATLDTVLGLWIELVYEKMGGDSELEKAPAPKAEAGKGKAAGPREAKGR